MYHAYKQEKKEEKEFEMITTILREQMREQVREQAEATAKLKQSQHLLQLLLSKRFGPIPPEIESSIHSLTDLDRIESIMLRFLELRDWQELTQLLKDRQN